VKRNQLRAREKGKYVVQPARPATRVAASWQPVESDSHLQGVQVLKELMNRRSADDHGMDELTF